MWVSVKTVSGSGSSSGGGGGRSSLCDILYTHHARTSSEVLTAVISEDSILQGCYGPSWRHFESSGGSYCLRLLNPEDEITLILRNVDKCRHNDTA